MFKLVVLFALLAVASAGVVTPYSYGHYAAPVYSVPSAVSYQSRTDVHTKPLVAAYAPTPVVTYAAAPVHSYAAAPVVAYSAPHYSLPSATSYQSRTDVHSKPIVTYSAPVVTGYAAPYAAQAYGYGYGYNGYNAGW